MDTSIWGSFAKTSGEFSGMRQQEGIQKGHAHWRGVNLICGHASLMSDCW